MTLYEITGQYLDLMKMLEDGIDEQTLADTFEGLDGTLEDKLDNCMKVVRAFKANEEAIDNEIERLKARKESCKNNAEAIRNRIANTMVVLEKKSIKTPFNTFSIQKNAPAVEVIGKIPKKFYVKQDPKLDKKALAEFLKTSGDTKYARLVQTESLRIR